MSRRPRTSRTALMASLTRQGFDRCRFTGVGAAVHVGCSQCEALCVNGVATHERGCPNGRRAEREAAADHDGEE